MMNYLVFIQFVMAFLVGTASLYLMYRFTSVLLKRQFGIQDLNLSLSIFQLGIIISTAFLLAGVITPASNALRFLTQEGIDVISVATSLGYIVGFVLVGLFSSALVVWGGVTIFFQLTEVNEVQEIKENNLPPSIVSSALIIGLSIIMSDYVGQVCEALIPYPDINFIP
jgi:uncharacterized membrane protein YjfL (UPF0719 family)